MIRAYILLIITVALWATSGPVAKVLLAYLPADVILSLRFGLVALILGAIFRPKLAKNHITAIVLLGLFGTVGQIGLIYWGLNYTSSIDATLLVSISPIFVAVLSHVFLHENITTRKLIGIGLGVLGTLIIISHPVSSNIGNILILLGNLSWAIYVVLSKKLLKTKISPIALTCWTFFFGFLAMTTISLFLNPTAFLTIPTLPLNVIGLLVFLGIGPGAIAYVCYQTALKSVKPTDADLFNYLAPIIATPIGVFWLGEKLQLSFIIGAAIIASGVIFAEFTRSKRR